MTEDQECVYHLGADCCLPIIISNWDEPAVRKRRPSDTPASQQTGEKDDTRSHSISGCSTTSAKWTTGFSEYVDGVWRSMTGEMRRKLRDACAEVLRRTDDEEELEKVFQGCDEDARFLD